MQDTAQTFEVTPENFQHSVVDRSRAAPVVLLFWAPQVLPSAEVRSELESLARPYHGKVFIGLVDVSRDAALAQHLRVQGLPSLRVVHEGQIIHQLDGAQSPAALRALLEELTRSPGDRLRDELAALIDAVDHGRALDLVRAALAEDPRNDAVRVELADLLVLRGELDEARRVLTGLPDTVPERERPQTRLEFQEEAAGLEDAATLARRLDADPGDLETRYRLAVRLTAAGDVEQALELLLELVRTDRSFRDDLGRLTMVRIFKLLGKGSELASRYRRRMFNYLH
jgi:putative thioredoxin